MNTITTIRPYKWSSWDCDIWEKNGNKVYVWNEQKWADFEVQGKYSLIPMQYHDKLKDIDQRGFMMSPQDETDLLYVVEGDITPLEVSDSNEVVDFGNNENMEEEYNNLMTKYNDEEEYPNAHEVLEELGYANTDAYLVIKHYQRKVGE